MEKYGRVGQTADDKIIRRMRFSCLGNRSKETDSHPEHVILTVFHGNSGYENAHKYYVMCIYPLLFEASASKETLVLFEHTFLN